MFLIDVTLSSYNCIIVVTAGLHMFVMKVVLFLYRCKSLTYEHNIRYNRGSPLPINRHLTFIMYYLLTYNTYYISYDQTLRLLLFLAVDCLLGGTTSSSDSSTSSSLNSYSLSYDVYLVSKNAAPRFFVCSGIAVAGVGSQNWPSPLGVGWNGM